MTHELHPFGFWRVRDDAPDDSRPWPVPSPHALPASARSIVRRYLTAHACIESFELAPAACRLACGAHRIGHATLTDGVFVWPEGFVHYFDEHGVHPPPAVVAAALAAAAASAGDENAWKGADAGEDAAADDDRVRAWAARKDELLAPRNHLQWDAESSAARPLPRATRDYLLRVAWVIDVAPLARQAQAEQGT